jgi:hypothetical protein
MLPRQYLQGTGAVPFEMFPGIFATPHHKHAGSSRFICSYADGQRHKGALFALIARAGQPEEKRGQWDLHHIVEGQHFADIDFGGRLQSMYQNELPVVLIQKDEHVAYNQLLHVSATDELFRDKLPADLLLRSQAAANAAKQLNQRAMLRTRVATMLQLYEGAYQGDPVLAQIARNVLNSAKALVA